MAEKSNSKNPSPLPNPTGREMEIVKVLWELGTGSVREVLKKLNENRKPPLAYTTVLRFLQIMREKGLVTREEGERGHIYQTSVPAENTKRQLAHDILEKVFSGSTHDLVLHALGGRKVSGDELREIKKLVSKIEKEESK